MRTDRPPLHVLAVDDDEDILRVYAELLAEEGYRVTTRRMPLVDPADVAALAPDAIVLDLLAGREDRGTGVLASLKADPATRGIPVLVCSADTARLEALEARLGAWDCGVMEKPFDIDVFVAAVRICLGKRPGGVAGASEPATV